MANQKAIKQKMGSVANLGKLTRAMEMVARSKMKRSVGAAYATRTFARLAREIMVNLSLEQYEENPFLVPGNGANSLLIIIGSNKGLCGGFNASMYRHLVKFREKRGPGMESIVIGKYAQLHAKKLNMPIAGSFHDVVEAPSADNSAQISKQVVGAYLNDKYDRVYIAYTEFESAFSQRPVVRPLLPLTINHLDEILSTVGGDISNDGNSSEAPSDTAVGAMGAKPQYLFEPDETTVMKYVIPGLVHTQIYQAILESAASEHAARMVAMKSASENADELYSKLELSYNRARQAGITNEIIDIAAGADAVSAT
ncbi:MAG: ATP synthase F1 subunit gamma [bacterium]|nr:ATP synthase F1 subunit gamma [bacterium]